MDSVQRPACWCPSEFLGGRRALAPGSLVAGCGRHEIEEGARMARPLPETFGRYRILRPLGEGGMGSVYLARDTQLDRLVALKVPRLGGDDKPSAGDLERFLREARAAAALLPPNPCPIFDVGE